MTGSGCREGPRLTTLFRRSWQLTSCSGGCTPWTAPLPAAGRIKTYGVRGVPAAAAHLPSAGNVAACLCHRASAWRGGLSLPPVAYRAAGCGGSLARPLQRRRKLAGRRKSRRLAAGGVCGCAFLGATSAACWQKTAAAYRLPSAVNLYAFGCGVRLWRLAVLRRKRATNQ